MELNHLPVIDWELGVKLAGNKRELAEEILGLLISRLPDEISSIKQSYTAKKYPELRQQLHKLRGALCYCGTPRLKIIVERLESDLKNNIMDDLSPLFNQLDTEVNLLLESLHHI